MAPAPPVLAIEGLEVTVRAKGGRFPAVDRLSLSIHNEETVSVVGESGCGKSMLALAIMRLVPGPAARIVGGSVKLAGTELTRLSERAMQRVRGKGVSMVFQEPMTSLNPVLTVGRQIVEAIRRHEKLPARAARARAREMLHLVRLPDAARRFHDYPHQLSGGMRQRVVIAIALACRPQLLLADEPTTALDVTIQAEILALMRDLQDRLGMALMLITHDLGVVAETADRVAVMYAGRKVEEATTAALFADPRHPYTRGLLRSVPGVRRGPALSHRLREIPGTVPPITAARGGCMFAARCAHVTDACVQAEPPLRVRADGHLVACWQSERLPEFVRD
jgi:peptide/nickel transport system ATP-binding protein